MTYRVLIACSLMLLFAACGDDPGEVGYLIDEEQLTYEEALDVNMIYSDSAIVRVEVSGPRMLRYLDKETPRQEFLDGVKVVFYSPGKKAQSILTAKNAVRYEKKNEIHIRDSVVWQSYNGERLETEELIWEERKGRVYNNRYVKITKPEEEIHGYGFEANQEFTEWTINAVELEVSADKMKAKDQ